MHVRRSICFVFLWVLLAGNHARAAQAADPFAENIRTTPRLSPDEEQKTFHLPPGFEIQLFASEPQIQKPMNLAFDAKGRLWITDTREYPFPVAPGQEGRDTIKILEDTDGDGRADKVTTFATGLNIPIGIYPDAKQVVAWSIPNIWSFRRGEDGDEALQKEKLYGPFGWERDTHGMNSSFTRGYDGWIYATHGFNNNTGVRGRDAHEIIMNSGNTYRFRLDGGRIEQFTWGQVNPFGLCFDEEGNLYSADCHSEPVYQLLRGAFYPSFGKPHDGLGFGPRMIFHDHGSTAISGIVFYSDHQWPEEFWHNVFTGNVMTSRINRDAVTFHGTTPTASARPDFVATDDPWFRPVNLQYGPDGAIYVADFYNRIIGHYEVPLNHPGRDRASGRIWRIFYRGATERFTQDRPSRFDVSRASAQELIDGLASTNMTRRLLALNELTDRWGAAAVDPLKLALAGPLSPFQKVHCLWALYRLGGLTPEILARAADDPSAIVRAHGMRISSETRAWTAAEKNLVRSHLHDPDPLTARCAADALGQHPEFENIQPLLEFRQRLDPQDTHLQHVVRMALRNQFLAPGNFQKLPPNLAARDLSAIADVAAGVPSADAGSFLLREIQQVSEPPARLSEYLRHAARYAPEDQTGQIAEFAQRRFAKDIEYQLALFEAVEKGAAQAGLELPEKTRQWSKDLAAGLLRASEASEAWTALPLPNQPSGPLPWGWERRDCSDGRKGVRLLSSFPPGERWTGILRSKAFPMPEKVSFYLAGQSGFPGSTQAVRNFFRLREAGTGKVIAETPVPRNDVAQHYVWELSNFAGRPGYFEIVDADDGPAYAWIAVGRLQPDVMPLPRIDPGTMQTRRHSGLQLIRSMRLRELTGAAEKLLNCSECDAATRAEAGLTLAALEPSVYVQRLTPLLESPAQSMELREHLASGLAEVNSPAARGAVLNFFKEAPWRMQISWAAAMASTREGADQLLEAVRQKTVSPQLVLERAVRDRLSASQPQAQAFLQKIAQSLPAQDDVRQKLIELRQTQFQRMAANAERGAAVFSKNCAVCHQIDGRGALIGPQLDGIGNRGLERLLEDILDPNRNVDRAFRTHLIILEDGDVLSGLPRREEGEVLVLADSTGKEIFIPKKQIKERRESQSSLMPDNFGDVLPPEEMSDLLAFLLAHRGK